MSKTQTPMKLPYVFLWGFITSLVVVGSLFWAFMAYEVSQLWPFSSAARVSQDKLFEAIRNSVTTAAALGVGVTLFFSYRRQQTAEKTQELAVEAQRTAATAQKVAAGALKLSTQQHELDQNRRQDALTADLRSRYGKAAEQLGADQLAVTIAGIYSLAALADDWAEQGNLDERQVFIDLLCSSLRSHQSARTIEDVEELERITLSAIRERLTAAAPARRFWGECRFNLTKPGQLPDFRGLVLQESGRLNISHSDTHDDPARLSHIELNGGSISLANIGEFSHPLIISESWLAKGHLGIGQALPTAEQEIHDPPKIIFDRVTFSGVSVAIKGYDADVIFDDCVFRPGVNLNIDTLALLSTESNGSVSFRNCLFETDLFKARHFGPSAKVRAGQIHVEDDCTYGDGVQQIRLEGGRLAV